MKKRTVDWEDLDIDVSRSEAPYWVHFENDGQLVCDRCGEACARGDCESLPEAQKKFTAAHADCGDA